MPRDYLAATLTRYERHVLGLIAINQDQRLKRDSASLRHLIERGFVEPFTEDIYGGGSSPIDRIPVMVQRYAVPLPVHMAWCEWCSRHCREDISP